jgi:hypothetical protein
MARADHLPVPGASLSYEVSGSGPVLLMVPGGPADSHDFVAIAPLRRRRWRSRVGWAPSRCPSRAATRAS